MSRGSNPLDLVASLGGAALSGLQMGANAAVVVGGGMGQAMLNVGSGVGKAFAGEAAFFDESITVRMAACNPREREGGREGGLKLPWVSMGLCCLASLAPPLCHNYPRTHPPHPFLFTPPPLTLPPPYHTHPPPPPTGRENQALVGQHGLLWQVCRGGQGGGHEVHPGADGPWAGCLWLLP